MNTTLDIESLRLGSGGHSPDSGAACVMELSSYLAREPWSDSPQCVSSVIAAFMRNWNDSLDDETRQKLKPYAEKVLNTAGSDEAEERRAWMATDWLARVCAPAWLRAAELQEHADKLLDLAPILDDMSAKAGQSALEAARSAARSAAWSAARSAARSAAESAAESAARSAAESAARSAAWSAAVEALQPTVTDLQASAFQLLDAMIDVYKSPSV